MLASFTALSTFASIIQQLYYATHWEKIKQADFEKAIKSTITPSIALSGPSEKTELVLFDIRKFLTHIFCTAINLY
jgi:hypothetical protein